MLAFWRRGDRERVSGPTLAGIPLGEAPWLVLGGGGLKGLAHLGAWRALREAGFHPAGILGTSIGALVGACLSGGRDPDELEAEARRLTRADITRIQRRALWVNGIRSEALFRGDVLRAYLANVLPPGGWEAMAIRFQANAVELGSGRTEWFGVGARTDVPLVEAIYASSALPLFYPPGRLPGGAYVDGGTGAALPIERAAELGATSVIAIDVGSGELGEVGRILEEGMLSIHQRVFAIMSGRRRRESIAQWNGPPLLYIRPDLDGYGTFSFENIEYFLEEGYRSTRDRIAGADGTPADAQVPSASSSASTRSG